MPGYRLIAVVRWDRRDPLLAACDDYLTRLRRYRPGELLTVRPGTRADEHARIARLWTAAQGPLVALDEHGQALSSSGLATQLAALERAGPRALTIVVGGAYGLPEAIRAQARLLWSLGPLTLPHRLALLVACEQLYRAHTILRGEPYHHA